MEKHDKSIRVILNKLDKNFSHYDNEYINILKLDQENFNLIKDFVRKCCENQKIICAENAKLRNADFGFLTREEDKEIDKDSILNCKNYIDV